MNTETKTEDNTMKTVYPEPPTYRSLIQQVVDYHQDNTFHDYIPIVRTIEIVTDGCDLYYNDNTRLWEDLPEDERVGWAAWIEAAHDFRERLASQDPDIREAFWNHPDRAEIQNAYDNWDYVNKQLDDLLTTVIEEAEEAEEA